MSFEAVKLLDDGNAIALEIPAHASGTRQPLYVGIFGPFRAKISGTLHDIFSLLEHNMSGEFDFGKVMR